MAVVMFDKARNDILKGVTDYSAFGTEYYAVLADMRELTRLAQIDNSVVGGTFNINYTGTGNDRTISVPSVSLDTLSDKNVKIFGGLLSLNDVINSSGSITGKFFGMEFTVTESQGTQEGVYILSSKDSNGEAIKVGAGISQAGVSLVKGALDIEATSPLNVKDVDYSVTVDIYDTFEWSTLGQSVETRFKNLALGQSLVSYTGDGNSTRLVNHGLTTSPELVVMQGGLYVHLGGSGVLENIHPLLGGLSGSVVSGNLSQVTLGATGNVAGTEYHLKMVDDTSSDVQITDVTVSGGSLTIPVTGGASSFIVMNKAGSVLLKGTTGARSELADTQVFRNLADDREGIVATGSVFNSGNVVISNPILTDGDEYVCVIQRVTHTDNFSNQAPEIPNNWTQLNELPARLRRGEQQIHDTKVVLGSLEGTSTLYVDVVPPIDSVFIVRKALGVDLEDGELLLFMSGVGGLPFTDVGGRAVLTLPNDNKLISIV